MTDHRSSPSPYIPDQFERFARLIPEALMDRSGSVFYSGRNAFSGERPLYLLGFNPGGDPLQMREHTVRRHTDKILRDLPSKWSAYRDESWQGARTGTRGMQPRVLHLLRGLRLDPDEVPASNIVFVRSRGVNTLEGNMQALAEMCWPLHRRVVEDLRVRVILCFGREAGAWVRNQLGADRIVGRFIEQNNRRWPSTAYQNRSGLTVVDATHPTRADWSSPATDPSALVREALHG